MKKNLGIKLVSLLVAILIWFQITLTSDHQASVQIKLKVTTTTPGDTLYSSFKTIPCIVQGRGLDILKLKHSGAYIQLSQEDISSGNFSNFETQNIPENLRVKFVRIDPIFISDLRKQLVNKTDTPEKPQDSTSDNDLRIYVVNIPIIPDGGYEYFPSSVTLKVKTDATSASSLNQDLKVNISSTPNARGLFSVTPKAPSGVRIVDFNPKQVRRVE